MDPFVEKVILNHISVAGHQTVLYQLYLGLQSKPCCALMF